MKLEKKWKCICKSCSKEFEAIRSYTKFCDPCKKIRAKEQQEKFNLKKKLIHTGELEIEDRMDITSILAPDKLFEIQAMCKKLKKGLISEEDILKKYSNISEKKLKNYIKRCTK